MNRTGLGGRARLRRTNASNAAAKAGTAAAQEDRMPDYKQIAALAKEAADG